MGRKKTNRTPATATPGVVGPTPMGGGSSRRGTARDQRGAAGLGFAVDQQQPEGARKLRAAGFFGDAMPRTTVVGKEHTADGRVVERIEPAHDELAPVTIADIDRAHYADMPVSKGGAKLSTRQKEAFGLPGGDGASNAAALLAEDADPVTNREGFLFFAEDLLPGLRGEHEAEDAEYDPYDAQQRADRLKVAEGMWKELTAGERREFVVQAEQDRARTAALRHVAGGPARRGRGAAAAGPKRGKPDGWHYVAPPVARRGTRGKAKAGSLVDALKEWSSDDEVDEQEQGEEEEQAGSGSDEEEEQAPTKSRGRGRAATARAAAALAAAAKKGRAAAAGGKRRRAAAAAAAAEEEEDEEDKEEDAAPRGRGRKAAAPKRGRRVKGSVYDGPESSSEEEDSEVEEGDSDAEEALAANDEEGTQSEADSASDDSEEEEEEEEQQQQRRRQRKPVKAAAAKKQEQPSARGKAGKAAVAKKGAAKKGTTSDTKPRKAADQGKAKDAPAAKRARKAGNDTGAAAPATRTLRGGSKPLEKDIFSATWSHKATKA